jgi:MFS family permease
LSHAAETRPATFREVFSVGEFRAIYTSTLLSWIGDYMVKAAVTAMVFRQTHSAAAAAITFAISYLPWAVGGPLLAALAERYPHRTTMVVCDVVRAGLMLLIALPGLPTPAMVALLFCSALFTPPFEAARSATLPTILPGDGYVLALSVQSATIQGAQVCGYLAGSVLSVGNPRLALLINAGTFALSAAAIWFGTRWRPAVARRSQRAHLVRETGEGFAIVFRTPVLRAIAVLILASVLFAAPPEGLAAVWAARLESDPHKQGLAQAIIMIGNPIGFLIAGLLIARLIPPNMRVRLLRPLAVAVPLCTVPALLNPSAPVVALLAGLAGAAGAGLLPAANGQFVRALPIEYRARAFGVMQTGIQVLQGASVLITGVLASYFALPSVVGWWGVGGVLMLLVVIIFWPAPSVFAETIERAREANAAAETAAAGAPETPAAPPKPRPAEDPSGGRIRTAGQL